MRTRLLLPAVLTCVAVLAACGGRDDRGGTNNKEVRAAAEDAGVTVSASKVAFGEPADFLLGDDNPGKFTVTFEAPEQGDPSWYEGQNLAAEHLAGGGGIVIARYTITAADEAATKADSGILDGSVWSADQETSGSAYQYGTRGVDQCQNHDSTVPLAVGESAEGCLTWLYEGAPGDLPAMIGLRGDGDFAIYDPVYWDAGE